MRRLIPLLLAFVAGLAVATALSLGSPASSSQRITLPTANSIGGGPHVVDPLDCRIGDPGYSGRAVCSWVVNP